MSLLLLEKLDATEFAAATRKTVDFVARAVARALDGRQVRVA